jgi:hypothetical protein
VERFAPRRPGGVQWTIRRWVAGISAAVRTAVSARRVRPAAVALATLSVLVLFALTHAASAGATVRVLAGTRMTWTLVLLGLAAAGPVLHSGLLRAGQATVGA